MKNNSLFIGSFGNLLKFSMEIDKENTFENIIDEHLIFLENDLLLNSTFCTGFSGSFWVMKFLESKNIIELEDDFFLEIDDKIKEYTFNYIRQNELDFLHGALGNLYYLSYNPKNDSYISKMVTQMNLLCVTYRKRKVFLYKNRFNSEKVVQMKVSLGLSHGLPSFIVIFSKLFKRGIEKQTCKNIITEQVNFIFELENENKNYPNHSFYPSGISLEDEYSFKSRVAWCYGDLGIAMAFYIAGNILNNVHWKEKAIEIFDYYITVKDNINTGISDAGICHGVAGVALMYYCIYYKTKYENYFKEAEYWLSELEQYQTIDKFGNITYGSYSHETKTFEKNETFLEGTCGVEIVINTITNKLDPSWAECLLIY